MALLTEAEFHATMSAPMTSLQPADDVRAVPLGDYLALVPESDLEGHDASSLTIERVYRDPTSHWIHVLIATASPNVYLAIVVDETNQRVHGHFLLDLNRAYGLD